MTGLFTSLSDAFANPREVRALQIRRASEDQAELLPYLGEFTALERLSLTLQRGERLPPLAQSVRRVSLAGDIGPSLGILLDLPALRDVKLGPTNGPLQLVLPWAQLEKLELYRTSVEDLPWDLGKALQLRHLVVTELGGGIHPGSAPRISSWPIPSHLEDLSIASNALTSLPEAIVNLRELKTLRAGSNPITSLPDVGELPNLRRLDLHKTQLRRLPEWVKNLGLEHIDLRGTKIPRADVAHFGEALRWGKMPGM